MATASAMEAVTPPKPKLSKQERETLRIEAEQAVVAEGGRRAEAMRRKAKALWEAHREPERVGLDSSRFVR